MESGRRINGEERLSGLGNVGQIVRRVDMIRQSKVPDALYLCFADKIRDRHASAVA